MRSVTPLVTHAHPPVAPPATEVVPLVRVVPRPRSPRDPKADSSQPTPGRWPREHKRDRRSPPPPKTSSVGCPPRMEETHKAPTHCDCPAGASCPSTSKGVDRPVSNNGRDRRAPSPRHKARSGSPTHKGRSHSSPPQAYEPRADSRAPPSRTPRDTSHIPPLMGPDYVFGSVTQRSARPAKNPPPSAHSASYSSGRASGSGSASSSASCHTRLGLQ
jgi:hypothetical protein